MAQNLGLPEPDTILNLFEKIENNTLVFSTKSNTIEDIYQYLLRSILPDYSTHLAPILRSHNDLYIQDNHYAQT